MKLLSKLILMLLIFSAIAFSQNNLTEEVPRTNYVKFVMTGSIDTAFVTFNAGKKFDYVSIASLSTGVDSLQVWTLQNDGAMWIQKGVCSLYDDTVKTTCVLSTSRREFVILDPQPNQLMLISPSDDGSVDTVIVQGKFGKLR